MLSSIRNSVSLGTLSLFLAGTAVLASCSKEDQATPAPAVAQHKTQDYTGEELFRGIFFFEGEVAAKVPAFDSYRTTIRKQIQLHPGLAAVRHRNIDHIVEAVRRLDPTYFDKLQQAIKSQNFERITAAIRLGTTLNEAVTLNAFTSDTQKQTYLQRKRVLQSLDMKRYDFSKEQDIARYTQDAKQALTAAGQDVAPVMEQIEASFVMVYQSGDYIAYQSVSVFIAEVAHAFFEYVADQSGESKLEAEMLIKQLALNLN
ncbi:hypothetical protein [Hymenobacter chitinivorans]|uniref:SdpC family antimicrobial peptide n=1 Tax=Hymenobacter chitinivorans DSM 11115 TaxID=1121954 RepID=A0A2M9BMP7_9BACT|nr:hypothetical protein [Hymenobacter chitinivorans]PJJ59219.1 SdpC family antimicrobial peptide [Hymenobacter chitinivorans DSM 11115]